MMKKLILFCASLVFVVSGAQVKETPILKIGRNVFSAEEFEFIYNKNNAAAQFPISRNEYFDLFVNYKMKVLEGKARGIDKSAQYKNESSYYFEEMARPFFVDTLSQKMADEAELARFGQEVNVSHILVGLPDNPTPADTLAAYNKLADARRRVLSGEDFSVVAMEVSEDPSAKSNGGYIGFFAPLQMVFPFENVAYNTPVGQVSDIFRTNYGYHFLRVNDKRPFGGEVQIAHIIKAFPRGVEMTEEIAERLKMSIDSIYLALTDGADFTEMASVYSDDKQSGMHGGVMPWFAQTNVIPEFADVAFSLTERGQLSKPFMSRFGWHVMKLVDRRAERLREQMEMMLKRVKQQGHPIEDAGYFGLGHKLMKEYSFKWEEKFMNAMTGIMMQQATDSVKIAQLMSITKPVARYGKVEVKTKDIAKDMVSMWQGNMQPSYNYDRFAVSLMYEYEKNRLVDKYADFKYTMQEYYDGLIVFEINKDVIWRTDDVDSTMLMDLYRSNLPRYSSGGHFKGTIYFCNSVSDVAKVVEIAKTDTVAASRMAYSHVCIDQNQGESLYDDYIWPNVQSRYVAVVGDIRQGSSLPFEQVKGQLMADYQAVLEQKWMAELKSKYKPKAVGKIKGSF